MLCQKCTCIKLCLDRALKFVCVIQALSVYIEFVFWLSVEISDSVRQTLIVIRMSGVCKLGGLAFVLLWGGVEQGQILFYLHYLTVGIPDAGPGELLLVWRLPFHRWCPCHSQNLSLCKGDNSLVRSKQRWIQRNYYRAKGCYRFSFQKCMLLGFAVYCQS